MLLVTLITAAVAWWLPPRYGASALVRLEADPSDDAALEARGVDVDGRRLQAVVGRVTDETRLRAASEKLPNLPPERLAAGLRVRAIAATSFWIEFVHNDPHTAALVANTVARLLVADTPAADDGQSAALEARLDEARLRLAERQAALARASPPATARRVGGEASTLAPGLTPAQALAEQRQAQQVYGALLAERDAAHAAARSLQLPARFELLREAAVPTSPTGPALPVLVLGGALLGLLLGLTLAAVAELRGHSVRGPEDLTDILPAPVLAIVPEFRAKDRGPA